MGWRKQLDVGEKARVMQVDGPGFESLLIFKLGSFEQITLPFEPQFPHLFSGGKDCCEV